MDNSTWSTFFLFSKLPDYQIYTEFQFNVKPLDPQDFGFLDPDPDPQKYEDPRIRIQGIK